MSQHVFGSGTRDSPFVIDGDDEDEDMITPGYRDDSYTPPDDLLLSPRPGTFLSTISRPRLPVMPVQGPNQLKEGSQQFRNRKRKRATPPPQIPPAGLPIKPSERINLLRQVVEVKPEESQWESKKQRKLRMRLERERAAAQELRAKVEAKGKQKAPGVNLSSVVPNQRTQLPAQQMDRQDENAPPAKRAKHGKLVPPMDRMSLTPGPVAGPSITKEPTPLFPISQGPHSQHQPTIHFPDNSASLPPPPNAYNSSFASRHPADHVPSLPPRPSVPQGSCDSIGSMYPQSQYGMEFDPLLPWLYMPMGAFSTSMSMTTMSIPPMSMMSTAPVNQPATQTNVAPPQKASSDVKQKAPKTGRKPQPAPPVPLPNPEKPFTIQVFARGTESTSQYYIPIGKPDYHFKHGIFPIIPSIMLPLNHFNSSSAPTSNRSSSYTPNILSTLILENIPKPSCNVSWVQKWCVSASGAPPKRILLGSRRALVEFREPGGAIQAWASPRLGVDEFGYRVSTPQGEAQAVIAFWYRPDLEQEKGLLRLWRHSKKMLPDFANATGGKGEGVAAKAIADMLEKMKPKEREEGELEEEEDVNDNHGDSRVFGIDTTSFPKTWSATDPKSDFRRVAERLGFWGKLQNAVNGGMNGDSILVWEQQEIARIDRARSIAHVRLKKKGTVTNGRKRKLKEDGEGQVNHENDSRMKRARKADGGDVVMTQSRASASTFSISKPRPTAPSTPNAAPKAPIKNHLLSKVTKSELSRKAAEVTTKSSISSFSLPQKPNQPPPPHSSKTEKSASSLRAISTSTAAGSSSSITAPSTTFAFSHPSKATTSAASTSTQSTSSIVKPARGFGLTFPTPPPVSFSSSQDGTPSTLSTKLSLPTPPLSAPSPQLPSMKKRSWVDLVAASPPSVVDPTPVTLPSALLTDVRHDDDMEVQGSVDHEGPLGGHRSDSLKSAVLRPSALLNVVKEREKEKDEDVGVSRDVTQAERVGSGAGGIALVNSGHASSGPKVDNGVGISGGGTNNLEAFRVTTLLSPLKLNQSNLGKGLTTVGQIFMSQSSPPSPSPSLSSRKSVAKPQVTPKSVPVPLSVSEPATPGVVPFGTANEDKSISSDDMDISPVSETTTDVKPPGVVVGITKQGIGTAVATTTTVSVSVPISIPTPAPASTRPLSSTQNTDISSKACAELVKTLAKPTEERQKFLDTEFKATRALMDKLMATTCKNEKKRITNLWKEKIRVIDEVTKSIRNDAKVWYSHEAKTWVRLRWPETPEGAGVLMIKDDDD